MISVFNSLGSNYDRASGAYRLRLGGRDRSKQLIDYLQETYSAQQVTLVYKGREALALALEALQLPAGSSVAINGYTCYAVYQAVVAVGLKPFYLDIEHDSLDFTATSLRAAAMKFPEIKAVIVQNTLGLPVDLPAIKSIAQEHNLPIIEDMAHCVGMLYPNGDVAGQQTEAAAFSFSQDKMIDAVTGGAVVLRLTSLVVEPQSASLRLRLTCRIYPWLMGLIRKTHRSGVGKVTLRFAKKLQLLPGPMSGDAQPAHLLPAWNAGLAQRAFINLDKTIAHRQKIAAIYRELLPVELQFPYQDGAVYLRFPLKVEAANQLVAYLKRFDINLGTRWYDAPIAPKWLHAKTDYQPGTCPNAEWLSERMINLPTHVHVDEKIAREIAERINQWLSKPA